MSLYFGNQTTMVTTVMLVIMMGYIAWLMGCRESIKAWGRHILILDIYGLYICCYAAARDGLHLTIQNAIDGSCLPGLFPLISLPTVVGAIGAAVIFISGVLSLFMRDQAARKKLCMATIMGIVLKIVVIELSRIAM